MNSHVIGIKVVVKAVRLVILVFLGRVLAQLLIPLLGLSCLNLGDNPLIPLIEGIVTKCWSLTRVRHQNRLLFGPPVLFRV